MLFILKGILIYCVYCNVPWVLCIVFVYIIIIVDLEW